MISNKLQRIPPYILAKVTAETKAARARGEDIIDYGMGNPDLPTPPHIVNKLIDAVAKPQNHRYSVSRGVFKLRAAICGWYKRRFNVELNPDTEAIATIGAKEGISHFMLALLNPGDTVIVPTPCYPIHAYSVVLAEGNVISLPLSPGEDPFLRIEETCRTSWPKPKAVIISFPQNPTGAVTDITFFERLVALAQQEHFLIVHDHAYAELCFDGYRSPSLLQVPGAKEVGVEFYSLSKTYNMPGWRVGFMVGNAEAVAMLARIKSYLDYGMFAPIQIAAITALNESQACVKDILGIYQSRRDILVDGLNACGWETTKPQGTMFVWTRLPEPFRQLSSVEFAMKLLHEANVSVAPGAGFGEGGEGFVRFALIENEARTKQALRGIKKMLHQ